MTREHDPVALLDYYLALGVDEAILARPFDRMAARRELAGRAPAVDTSPASQGTAVPAVPAPRAPARRGAPAAPGTGEPGIGAPGGDPGIGIARRAAAGAASLADLRAALEAFDACPLKATARNLVMCDGAPDADLMLIGEAPGEEEDRTGRPFVGTAGRLLDRMLGAIGRDRTSVYITNTVFWRPPVNRTPDPAETAMCLPFVERQIELVRPRALLLLGAVATRTMLARTEGIMRLRGKWQVWRDIDVMPTLHPAYLLRFPAAKREVWQDLLALRARLDAPVAPPEA